MLFRDTGLVRVIMGARRAKARWPISLRHALRPARQGAPQDESEGVCRRRRLRDLDGRRFKSPGLDPPMGSSKSQYRKTFRTAIQSSRAQISLFFILPSIDMRNDAENEPCGKRGIAGKDRRTIFSCQKAYKSVSLLT